LTESQSQLDKLDSTLTALVAQRSDHLSAINIAKGLCDRYTRSDVFKLGEELDSLQSLHLWKVESVDQEEIRLRYDDEVRVVLPVGKGGVDIARVEIESVDEESSGSEGCKGGSGKAMSAMGVWRGKGMGPTAGLRRVWEEAVKVLAGRRGMTLANVSCFFLDCTNTNCEKILVDFR
jgi:kinetochore protein Spc7/SPC105